jgi:hypothetical protein
MGTQLPNLSSRPNPDSCYAAQDMAVRAAFIKESRMEPVNAKKLDRNPGERSEVDGPAVRLHPKQRPCE